MNNLKINKGEEAVIKALPRRLDGQSIKWFCTFVELKRTRVQIEEHLITNLSIYMVEFNFVLLVDQR